MLNVARDPDAMPEDDRLSEIAAILARGYLRLLRGRQKALEDGQNCLDDGREDEAPCDRSVNTQRKERVA